MTFWIDDVAIKAWHCLKHQGHRGRRFIFSDTVIETSLMMKGIFKLQICALDGVLNEVLPLMNVPLRSPTYTCISKHSKP
ncbi:Mobile element protein [Candidatus Enterovibrio escicola]|uniref:Mobile element protein n=1 Tax=Candidatus Enterovibrio escicola TaxID=1927127 RepID=A0A2A5T6N0_9GAMM|nr:Mobile element protein [Candidatus Enterovibrio escacola]